MEECINIKTKNILVAFVKIHQTIRDEKKIAD